MPEMQFAIILGSGFDRFADEAESLHVETRFGQPSAPIKRALLEDKSVLLLSRHGEHHSLPPHVINYRANLAALQASGAEAVIAVNTVGAISTRGVPGTLAVPDQIIDYTWGRAHTLYDSSDVNFSHIDFTTPFTPALRQSLLSAATECGVDCVDGGVYAATQGPRLETAAEVDRLERDGADLVGMTAMPEAALARELGLDYACLALIVNRAAGRGDKPIHDDVAASTRQARQLAMQVIRQFFR